MAPKPPTTNYQLPTTKRLRVAIVCDWLTGTGGAERVVLELHRMFPDAPIYTSQYDSNPKIWYGDKWFADADIRTTWLQKLPKGLRKFLPILRAWTFSRLDLSGYDLVISSSGAESKGVRTTPKKSSFMKLRSPFTRADVAQGDSEQRTETYIKYGEGAAELATQRDAANSGSAGGSASRQGTVAGKRCVHISYIHAPTHYYWNRYEQYMKNPGFGALDPLARLGLKLLAGPMRRWDKKAAGRPDYLVANSTHTKSQIEKYYARSSEVIHPPVDISRFKPSENTKRQGFITAGRQTPYKRIDLAIAACTKLALSLTVIGNGPDHKRLGGMAGPMVKFLTDVPDEDMPLYFQKAEAFLFPGIDDFGIVAVEALAAGTPVIAFKGGGALDYVTPATGLLFNPQTVEALGDCLQDFSKKTFDHKAITEYADKFSADKFRSNMRLFIDKAMKGKS